MCSVKYPWALAITYVDEKNNAFLTLGGAAWRTKRERDANLVTIPTVPDSKYVLGIEGPQGIMEDRFLDAATVATLLGSPVKKLIADAGAQERQEAAAALLVLLDRAGLEASE